MNGLKEMGTRWARYAAEVVTIVVGILLALAADAGYRYLADRASEREILGALRVEFAADVDELRADQQHRVEKLASIDLLKAVRKGEAGLPAPEILANALLNSLDYRFYTPSHPVLDDLLATGRLELIRSDELRHALMVFGQARSRIAVVEQREREFVATQIEPFLAARLDLDALAAESPDELISSLLTVSELLGDKFFGSLLFLDRERTQSSTDFADNLLNTVFRVQELLNVDG